jgi:16S rRNA processing protein RimM
MTSPEFIIVGRIRKAHGVRGEVVVESITDAPDAIFASGLRVFAGNVAGDVTPARQEMHISSVRTFNEGLLVRFDEIADRTAADLWRGRYLLVPAGEVPAPADDEVFLHDLLGMSVVLIGGQPVGTVEEFYELPQGLAIDVRRAAPREKETVMLLYDDNTIVSVDKESRTIVVRPPEGLLE